MAKIMNNKSWDDLAADYDKSVEDNQSHLVINYLKEEIEILKNLCEKHSRLNKNFSVIDMGAGTGRVVLPLMRNCVMILLIFWALKILI